MTFLKRVPNSEVVDGQEEEAPGPSEMRRLEEEAPGARIHVVRHFFRDKKSDER